MMQETMPIPPPSSTTGRSVRTYRRASAISPRSWRPTSSRPFSRVVMSVLSTEKSKPPMLTRLPPSSTRRPTRRWLTSMERPSGRTTRRASPRVMDNRPLPGAARPRTFAIEQGEGGNGVRRRIQLHEARDNPVGAGRQPDIEREDELVRGRLNWDRHRVWLTAYRGSARRSEIQSCIVQRQLPAYALLGPGRDFRDQ